MKTLGPHPITADLLHFLCALDTMIHAWAPFRLRADFPGRINVIYKKLHIQGPSEGHFLLPHGGRKCSSGKVGGAASAWRQHGEGAESWLPLFP